MNDRSHKTARSSGPDWTPAAPAGLFDTPQGQGSRILRSFARRSPRHCTSATGKSAEAVLNELIAEFVKAGSSPIPQIPVHCPRELRILEQKLLTSVLAASSTESVKNFNRLASTVRVKRSSRGAGHLGARARCLEGYCKNMGTAEGREQSGNAARTRPSLCGVHAR